MSAPLVISFDVGTQSTRAMLVNENGEIVAKAQKKYDPPYYSKHPNWAEQSPEFYFECMCEASRELAEKAPEQIKDAFAVTLAVIRDTPVFLDAEYRPVRDAIVWLDGREANADKCLTPLMKTALSVVGMSEVVKAQHKKTTINWVKQNEPEVWKKTAHCVMLPTYLNYRLTGKLIDSAANMIGHIPFNYKQRAWCRAGDINTLIVDIPADKLCPLVPSGEVIGTITPETSKLSGIAEGLPLIATGSDKGCETLGLSVVHKNQAALSFGTTATIQFSTDKYFEPQPFLPAYPAIRNELFNPEIQIYRGYWMISWFKQEFAHKECLEAERVGRSPEELLNERLAEVPAGCQGLMLQPFWGPGVRNPEAKGAVIGFSDVHTRIHIYRAIIEGIGFTLLDGMYTMQRRSGQTIEELFVAGGGSQSDEICRITADMFGLPVKRIQSHEACGIGAAMVAFVSKGIFKSYDEAIAGMVHVKDVFTPDAKTHAVYERIYRDIYSNIYQRLSPLYKRQRDLKICED